MSITIAGLWGEGRHLSERHAVTVVPIAAAFIFLPQVVRTVLAGPQAVGAPATFGDVIAFLIIMAIAFIGQISIASIMLGGRDAPRDVADALQRATRRVPRAILAFLLIGVAALPLVLLAALVVSIFVGAGALADPQRMIRAAAFLVIPVVAIFAFFGARLFVMFPILAAETLSAREMIRRSWHLTARSQWPLIGFMLSALVALIFLTTVINIVAGATFGLLLGANSLLAQLLSVTLGTLAGTAIGIIVIGASVAAYRQLADGAGQGRS